MNIKSRIASIQNAVCLDESISGFSSFDLRDLVLPDGIGYSIPTNLRLGHLAEKVVAQLLKHSANFKVIHENIQIFQDKHTIGELDFILEEINTGQLIHLELAYKFYLFVPTDSIDQVSNWIGPNRGDSLVEKLHKLKSKQFPLLRHPATEDILNNLTIQEIKQALCFLINLYVPYAFKGELDPRFAPAIKGYHLSFDTFKKFEESRKQYCLPSKLVWGTDPGQHAEWVGYQEMESRLEKIIGERQSVLCWEREGDKYNSFFVTWW